MELDMAFKYGSQIYIPFLVVKSADWQIRRRNLGIWEDSVWYLSLYVRIH